MFRKPLNYTYVCFLVLGSRNDAVNMRDFGLNAKKMSSAFFRDITQYVLAIHYRRFGTNSQPHLQGSWIS
jgi:hypothetical protein